MKYLKKPTPTEATQWWRNGDHPNDKSKEVELADGGTGLSEGEVVQYFRTQHIPGGRFCHECGAIMQKHGLLNGLNGEELIHPGDYIVTTRKGDYYRLSQVDFEEQYEPYEPAPTPSKTPSRPKPLTPSPMKSQS